MSTPLTYPSGILVNLSVYICGVREGFKKDFSANEGLRLCSSVVTALIISSVEAYGLDEVAVIGLGALGCEYP